jgi:hypothetical protein
MQVVSWLVVKINCHINVRALFKWQYIHLYSGVASVTARAVTLATSPLRLLVLTSAN